MKPYAATIFLPGLCLPLWGCTPGDPPFEVPVVTGSTAGTRLAEKAARHCEATSTRTDPLDEDTSVLFIAGHGNERAYVCIRHWVAENGTRLGIYSVPLEGMEG